MAYSAFHNLFSLYCSKWSGDAMKKLRKRKSYSTFSLNSMTFGENEKVGWFYFFFILLNSLLSGSRSGALKKGTRGTGVKQKPCFVPSLPNFFFHLNWTHCWSAAGQLKEWGNTFFVYLFWTAADIQQNEKVFAKTTFFSLNWTAGAAAPNEKKRLWNSV